MFNTSLGLCFYESNEMNKHWMSFNRSNIKQQGRDDLRNRWNMKKDYTMINKDQGLECFSEKHKQETHLGICIITCKVLTPAE